MKMLIRQQCIRTNLIHIKTVNRDVTYDKKQMKLGAFFFLRSYHLAAWRYIALTLSHQRSQNALKISLNS